MVICGQPLAAAIGVLSEQMSAMNEQVGAMHGTGECTNEADVCVGGTDECERMRSITASAYIRRARRTSYESYPQRAYIDS